MLITVQTDKGEAHARKLAHQKTRAARVYISTISFVRNPRFVRDSFIESDRDEPEFLEGERSYTYTTSAGGVWS